MQIIGISGHPGAGKSTFSEMILKNENVKVVHMDHLLDKLRKIVPGNNLREFVRDDGEEVMCLNRDGLFYKVTHMKVLKKAYDYMKVVYMRRELKRIIRESYKEGFDYLVVEGAYLIDFFDIEIFNRLILVEAEDIDRKQRVGTRDRKNGVDQEEFFDEITKYEVTFDKSLYDYIVFNIGTVEELDRNANRVSRDITNCPVYKKKTKIN